MIEIVFIIFFFIIMYVIFNRNYDDILEFPGYKFNHTKYQVKIENNLLEKSLKDFISKNLNYNYIVSLSGGVDSMVTLFLLSNLINNSNLTTATIDYNQRKESSKETRFITEFCRYHNIDNHYIVVSGVKRKNGTKRKVFEETSQKIRYDLYKDIIQKKKWNYDNTIILLGHHKDDLRENIINNFMLGRSLYDLEVMKEKVIKNDLILGRPFLNHEKDEIYEIAHKYKIPYFKDTTPTWSKRGLMRNKLFPLLEEIYPNFKLSLDRQGKNSRNVLYILNVLSNYLDRDIIELKRNGVEVIYKMDNNSDSELIWSRRISTILHEEGKPMVSKKSLETFLEREEILNWHQLNKNVKIKKNSKYVFLKILLI